MNISLNETVVTIKIFIIEIKNGHCRRHPTLQFSVLRYRPEISISNFASLIQIEILTIDWRQI